MCVYSCSLSDENGRRCCAIPCIADWREVKSLRFVSSLSSFCSFLWLRVCVCVLDTSRSLLAFRDLSVKLRWRLLFWFSLAKKQKAPATTTTTKTKRREQKEKIKGNLVPTNLITKLLFLFGPIQSYWQIWLLPTS